MKLERMDFWSGEAHKNSIAMPGKFSTNINISKASAIKDKLNIEFQYLVSYEPDGSTLTLGGTASFASSDAKKAAEEWVKTKRFGGEDGEAIVNAINYNATAHMVLFARLFNLVPPLTLPILKFEEKPPSAQKKRK
jgi:hypothetical protein